MYILYYLTCYSKKIDIPDIQRKRYEKIECILDGLYLYLDINMNIYLKHLEYFSFHTRDFVDYVEFFYTPKVEHVIIVSLFYK